MLKSRTSPKVKPVLIALHGFGKKRTEELSALAKALEEEYTVFMPELFDPEDVNDFNGILWANRALNYVEKQMMATPEIVLAGFSMGGVIASWIATLLPIEKLILVSPAFDLINLKNTGNILSTFINQWAKHGTPIEFANFLELPTPFYQTLIDVVLRYRSAIHKVTCPVLLIHGSQDDIVSSTSSKVAFAKIASKQKQMFIIVNGHHVLFEDEGVCQEVIALIQLFLDNKIVCRPFIEEYNKTTGQ